MLVKLTFLDHSHNGDGPIVCIVYGQIVKEDKVFIRVVGWDLFHSDMEVVMHNREVYNILKSTIIKKEELIVKPKKKNKKKKGGKKK